MALSEQTVFGDLWEYSLCIINEMARRPIESYSVKLIDWEKVLRAKYSLDTPENNEKKSNWKTRKIGNILAPIK
jgi:hypothetical protein